MGEKKPIITGYPRGWALSSLPQAIGYYAFFNQVSKEHYFKHRQGNNNVPSYRTYYQHQKEFKSFGFPRHGDRRMGYGESIAFSYGLSAAQIFADGKFVKEVPINTSIRFLEEEQYISILAYMQGYNFYVPRVTPLMHQYTEDDSQNIIAVRPNPMDDFPDTFIFDSYLKEDNFAGDVFNVLKDMKKTPRSFKDYEKAVGIDYEKRRLPKSTDKVHHSEITAYVNYLTELYDYSLTDGINWMYDPNYEWVQDVQKNESQ